MRKSYHESVHIDDMLAMALCIDSGIWRKRRSEDIDYYSSLLNVENLFPEKKGPGRPREPGQAAPRRKEIRIIKKENGEEVQEEVEVSDPEYRSEPDMDPGSSSSEDERPHPKPMKEKKKRGRKPKIKMENGIEVERERFTCEKCGKTYLSTNALYRHIEKTCLARDSMKVEFKRIEDDWYCAFEGCAMGNQIFACKENLEDHWAEFHVAEEDKIIPCQLCDVKFATLGAKKVHMNRDHEKTFACEKCPKKFYTQSNLNYHKKVHQKIKLEDGTEISGETYLCLKCGQTLCRAYGKQHEAKCTGMFVRHPEYKKMNDEYFCTVDGCQLGYGFNSIYGLRQHFHGVHVREEEKYFSCDYCDEKFSFRTTRNKHIKAKHLKVRYRRLLTHFSSDFGCCCFRHILATFAARASAARTS